MPGLIVRSESPFNAEPPLDRLCASLLTPQSDFYVRSHGEVPVLSEASHGLRIDGRVKRPLVLSMRDLRGRFAARTVTAAMQCAGNRRAELHSVRPVMGDRWTAGAIGNAAWTGVRLADLLEAAGAANDPALHVAFEACDTVAGQGRYGASIPLTKAVCPEVLLAFEMNGETLSPEHGFPLRAVVPGYAGVRSPKWLTAITVQEQPSANPVQQTDYKLLPADVTRETVDWATGVTINEMPLNSAICEPHADANGIAGELRVRGYALATGMRVERVEVSANGGRDWCRAKLQRRPDAPWSWTLWEATLHLPGGDHELAVRAWDAAGQTQPAHAADLWNFKGYLCNAWHRVPIRLT